MARFTESQGRSLTKSLTFRVLVIISDLIVIYILTRQIATTIAVTIFTNLASTTLYFVHERVWNSIKWGRQRITS